MPVYGGGGGGGGMQDFPLYPGLTCECFTSSAPEGWTVTLSSAAISGCPSFSHLTSGRGLPLALQGSSACMPSVAATSGRLGSMAGGTVGRVVCTGRCPESSSPPTSPHGQ